MQLDEIVPWGRNFGEYCDMFSLQEADLEKSILGCGDGPASFNAELTARGGTVVSVDPVYCFSATEIEKRIQEVRANILSQAENKRDDFNWDSIGSVAELEQVRMTAMNSFLEDYSRSGQAGRYLGASVSALPFADDSFDLALSSHFLFLYSEHLDLDEHIRGISELARVAREVRIFPLLDLEGRISPHLVGVKDYMKQQGLLPEQLKVNYHFQKGANEMLVIRRPA